MIRPALLFTDNAVLQADAPVPVWGETDEEDLTVSFAGQFVRAKVEGGHFSAVLSPMPAWTKGEMVLSGGAEEKRLRNIIVGEVWLAGGQSNMEHPAFCADFAPEDLQPDPDLRLITVPRRTTDDSVTYGWFFEPVIVEDRPWQCADSASIPHFSAIGYACGHFLRKGLAVPVGVIACNWGGTPIEAWVREAYLTLPITRRYTEEYREKTGSTDTDRYRAEYARREAARQRAVLTSRDQMEVLKEKGLSWFLKYAHAGFPFETVAGPLNPVAPYGLRRTMLSRVTPYAIRGVLWHQGESNARNTRDCKEQYVELLKAMFADWRDAFGRRDLPFYLVQIATFGEDQQSGWRDIRAAQEEITRVDPACSMVVSMDLGEKDNIHPRRKKEMGRRLAEDILRREYGLAGMPAPSPVLTGADREKDRVICRFSARLVARDGEAPRGFTAVINGEEKVVPVEIHGSEVRLSCAGASLVAYGNRNDYQYVNVYDEAGQPLVPFTVPGIV